MCGSETRMLRNGDKEIIKISQMRFLGSLLGVTLRNKMRSEDMQECLETENRVQSIICTKVEDVEEMVLNICHGKHIIRSLLENAT
jgi:hypothetical protein